MLQDAGRFVKRLPNATWSRLGPSASRTRWPRDSPAVRSVTARTCCCGERGRAGVDVGVNVQAGAHWRCEPVMAMRIRELAASVGTSTRTLRYYEAQGTPANK